MSLTLNGVIAEGPVISEYYHKPVAGDLTGDGAQWSTTVRTAASATNVTAFSCTVDPGLAGAMLWIELGLNIGLSRVSSTAATMLWKWQGRNKSATAVEDWVDLHTAVSAAAQSAATAVAETAVSGYKALASTFNEVPFELQLLIQASVDNEGVGKVKNSSYIRVISKTR